MAFSEVTGLRSGSAYRFPLFSFCLRDSRCLRKLWEWCFLAVSWGASGPWVGLKRGWLLGLGAQPSKGRFTGLDGRLTVIAGREVALSSVRTLSQLEVTDSPRLGGASRSEEPMREQHLLSCCKDQGLLMVHCFSSSESSFWEGHHMVRSKKSIHKPLLVLCSTSKCLGDPAAKGPALWLRTCPRGKAGSGNARRRKPGILGGAQMDGKGHMIDLIPLHLQTVKPKRESTCPRSYNVIQEVSDTARLESRSLDLLSSTTYQVWASLR